MAKKKDAGQLMDKYGPVLKKIGDELGEAAKKGEEGVVKMSKIVKIQIDMLGLSLQREKIYYDLGKEVAAKLLKNDVDISSLEKYTKKLLKLQSVLGMKKKTMQKVSEKGKSRKKNKK